MDIFVNDFDCVLTKVKKEETFSMFLLSHRNMREVWEMRK